MTGGWCGTRIGACWCCREDDVASLLYPRGFIDVLVVAMVDLSQGRALGAQSSGSVGVGAPGVCAGARCVVGKASQHATPPRSAHPRRCPKLQYIGPDREGLLPRLGGGERRFCGSCYQLSAVKCGSEPKVCRHFVEAHRRPRTHPGSGGLIALSISCPWRRSSRLSNKTTAMLRPLSGSSSRSSPLAGMPSGGPEAACSFICRIAAASAPSQSLPVRTFALL